MEKFADEKSFVKEFLKNHKNEIISSEPHYLLHEEIKLADSNFHEKTNTPHFPKSDSAFYTSSGVNPVPDPSLNWGQRAIEANILQRKNISDKEVILAIPDSGMDRTRPQLQNVIAINENEEINGIDDDENGFIDDRYGFDFIGETHKIKDYTGHGTHIAGIIAAQRDFGVIQGVAPQVKILPLSFIDKNKKGLVHLAVRALRYASQRGAKVINASWGSSIFCSNILKNEINSLREKNILFITVAGNKGKNLDESPIFPASFGLDNVIVVGASTPENAMAHFSNYGSSVDLVAPGINIISTYPLEYDKDGIPDGFYSLSGTSSAVPFVSAAVALLWLEKPNASYTEVKKALLKGVKLGPYPVNTGGHLHIPLALEAFNRL